MKVRPSPYHRPWCWLLREAALIGMFAGTAWALRAFGPEGIPQLLVTAGLIGIIVVLTLRMVADILVAGICSWLKAMGGGLGSMVASIREVRRCDRARRPAS